MSFFGICKILLNFEIFTITHIKRYGFLTLYEKYCSYSSVVDVDGVDLSVSNIRSTRCVYDRPMGVFVVHLEWSFIGTYTSTEQLYNLYQLRIFFIFYPVNTLIHRFFQLGEFILYIHLTHIIVWVKAYEYPFPTMNHIHVIITYFFVNLVIPSMSELICFNR